MLKEINIFNNESKRINKNYKHYENYCLIVNSQKAATTLKYLLDNINLNLDYDIEKYDGEIGFHYYCKHGQKDIEQILKVLSNSSYPIDYHLCAYNCHF